MNMDMWVVGTVNQLFRGDSHFQVKFSKTTNKRISGKTLFVMMGPFFTPHSSYFNIRF